MYHVFYYLYIKNTLYLQYNFQHHVGKVIFPMRCVLEIFPVVQHSLIYTNCFFNGGPQWYKGHVYIYIICLYTSGFKNYANEYFRDSNF